jgi:DNA mismatch repair ATPase MutS
MCEQFYHKYAGAFINGERDFRTVFAYSGELGFLLDASDYFIRLRNAGYPLTYPSVSLKNEVVLNGVADASLAKRELRGEEVVPNDLLMAEEYRGERLSFYILTGANGGGKTTFLRACGLAVLFFLAGCPVTASSARIRLFDAVYTHFPANESFENSGRFVNEANRAEEIIGKTDENTFVLFNETYSGTDEQKSEQYSRRLADTMYERGVFGMFVTHIHALTGSRIPTLAAVIDETDENRRTYKIRRVGATSSSFAEDILEKYRLDRESLKKRLEGEHHAGT